MSFRLTAARDRRGGACRTAGVLVAQQFFRADDGYRHANSEPFDKYVTGGMASYMMNSHTCARFVEMANGRARVLNERDVPVPDPHPFSHRAIVPRKRECEALLAAGQILTMAERRK